MSSILPKKEQKKIDLTTMIPQVDSFLFVCWKILRHQEDILKLTDLYIHPILFYKVNFNCQKGICGLELLSK